jgi:hypothetical protein
VLLLKTLQVLLLLADIRASYDTASCVTSEYLASCAAVEYLSGVIADG